MKVVEPARALRSAPGERRATRRRPSRRRTFLRCGAPLRRATPAGAAAVIVMLAIGVHGAGAAEPPAGDRPVVRRPISAVVISIDSLRADHLPFHGYPRMTTPFLNGLFESGELAVFERMTAASPSCHPSHVTILTGQYPHQVGVPLCGEDLVVKHSDLAFEEDLLSLQEFQADLQRRPEPYQMKKKSAIRNMMQIPPGTQTLATFLQKKGYRTGASVAIWTLDGRFGYERGFDLYADRMTDYYGPRSLAWVLRDLLGTQLRHAGSETLDAALEFIAPLDPVEPFFLFLHFGDTHVPYGAPDEVEFDETPAERDAVEEEWRSRYSGAVYEEAMAAIEGAERHLLDEYDRSIRYVDSLVEKLFEHLDKAGLLQETAVVITSDHGDSFGQHRWLKSRKQDRLFFEHSVYVWEETQSVPLLVHDPSGRIEHRRHAVNASHVDIVPTLLALLGHDSAAFAEGELPGSDLAELDDDPRTVFFMTFGRGRPGLLRRTASDYPRFLGFRSGDWKFFLDRDRLKNASAGRCYLFDLAVDPDEKTNLCGQEEHDGRAARFRGIVVEWWNRSTSPRRPGGRP